MLYFCQIRVDGSGDLVTAVDAFYRFDRRRKDAYQRNACNCKDASGNNCFRQAESRLAGLMLFSFQLANRGHVSIPEEAVAIAAAGDHVPGEKIGIAVST